MRIAFADFAIWDYTIDSAYERPLGGSQSALCYLAEELARGGHQVLLLNNTARATTSRGVVCKPLSGLTSGTLRGLDALVLQNAVTPARDLKPHLDAATRLILWTQHAHDQPAVQTLKEPGTRGLFDAFVLVSNWQRDMYLQAFGLEPGRCQVLRNAVGPAFYDQLADADDLIKNKATPPILAYTSTPFRGLGLLLDAFEKIRQGRPAVTLEVFSSMQVYQFSADKDQAQFGELYRRCQQTAGVHYVGSLPQPELAKRLARASVLAYPNSFPETSCIAVMEAMAAGCHVVTSDLAALPETTAGFGTLVPVTGNWDAFTGHFVEATLRVLEAEPSAAEQIRRRSQVEYVRDELSWKKRSAEWVIWRANLP